MRLRTTLLAGLVALAPSLVAAGTLPIYVEAFNGSTLNGPTVAPTASTTGYQILSTKSTSSSALGSTLDISMGSTSSGLTGVQALFANTPVSLNAGECIDLVMTFQGTNLMSAGVGSQSLNFGLYNSGGQPPVPNGPFPMSSGGTTNVTGNAQNWEGYVGRIGVPSGSNSSEIYTRDPQTDTTDENQDVLFNNAGSGAYDNPGGVSVAGSGPDLNLLDATDYTASLMITYDGTDVTVDQNVYLGTAASGTPIYSHSGTQSGGYTTFDALSFGFRGSAGSNIIMSVSSLEVRTGLAVPEPASLALLGLASFGLLARRRQD